jgi:hypothetical protein
MSPPSHHTTGTTPASGGDNNDGVKSWCTLPPKLIIREQAPTPYHERYGGVGSYVVTTELMAFMSTKWLK